MKRAIAIILSVCLALSLNVASAAITPPAAGDSKPRSADWQLFILADDRVTTGNWNSSAALTIPYNACALHYVSTIGSSNALTISLQGSNNGKDWVSFATNVVTTVTTAQNDIYQFNNPTVQYVRVSTSISTSNALTLTYFMACR